MKRKRIKGFTLLELMVTIALIAILAAIVTVALQRARERSRYVGCMSNMRSIAVAVEIYMTDDDLHMPPDDVAKLEPDYIKNIPTNYQNVEYGYLYTLAPQAYTVFCPGVNHMLFDVPTDYPRYASDTGLLERPQE